MSARPGGLLLSMLLAGVLAVGCSATSKDAAVPVPPGPDRQRLIAVAHLDPCPASTAAHPPHSLPDITLPCLGAGPAVHLSGLSGLPTVVNIWGSWCGPCQAETRYLATVYDAGKTKVRFLGVDTEDDPNSALDFAAHVTPPMRYPNVVDKDKSVLIALHLPSAVPTTVFVAGTGRVARVHAGPYRSSADLRADIRRYLGVSV